MQIGYARVSIFGTKPDMQEEMLRQAGCSKVLIDKTEGNLSNLPELMLLKEQLLAGDTLMIQRLDRLGRSLKELIEWVNYLNTNNITLISLEEALDSSSTAESTLFSVFKALANFEKNLIHERTSVALSVARTSGKLGGRPKTLDLQKQQLMIDLYQSQKMPVWKICQTMKISKPTLYKYIKDYTKTQERY